MYLKKDCGKSTSYYNNNSRLSVSQGDAAKCGAGLSRGVYDGVCLV